MIGVNPYDGTVSLDAASAFTIVRLWTLRSSEMRVAACDNRPAHHILGIDHVYSSQGAQLRYLFRQLKSSSRLELNFPEFRLSSVDLPVVTT
jgi:hypothetical protein